MKSNVFVYKVGENLYINLTNRCNANCVFCLRQTREEMENSGSLWLEREPTVQEVKRALEDWDVEKFNEVVFCGFGEPTLRLEMIPELADFIHEKYKKPVRLNTNGLANLEYGRDVTPLFRGKIDVLSVSLNTPDKKRYFELTRNRFGVDSFDGMLDFVRRAKTYVPEIILSTVATTLTAEEEERCKKICDDLGVTYRIRPFET